MSFSSLYRKRFDIKGKTSSEQDYNFSKKEFNDNFKDDLSYREAEIVTLDLEISPIDIRVSNLDRTPYIKRFELRPETKISTGTMFRVDDDYYLTTSVEYNYMSPVANVKKCNQTLNSKDLPFPICIVAEDSAYNDKGEIFTELFSLVDGKVACYFPNNIYSKTIKQNKRYIFNNSEDLVFEVISKKNVVDPNVHKIVMKKVEADLEHDDFENNIAFNDYRDNGEVIVPPTPDTLEVTCNSYNGEMEIRKYSSVTFTITYNGTPSDDFWRIDVEYNGVPTGHVSIVETTTNAIKIKNNLGNCVNSIILHFTNDLTGEMISVEVILIDR